MDPQLLGAVAVEIEPLDDQPLAAAQLALGERQLPPDRGPQVRQVQSSEHPVPVGIVALGPADGAARGRRVAARAAQPRQREHFLVHAIRLGVLHEEVAPVRAAHQRPLRPRQAGLAQLLLEHGEAARGHGRQRPRLHLPVGSRWEISEAPAPHGVERRAGGRETDFARGDERPYAIEELR